MSQEIIVNTNEKSATPESVNLPSDATVYCHKCGKRLVEAAMFCPYCGEKRVKSEVHNSQELEKENKTDDSVQIESPVKDTDTEKSASNIAADEIVANFKMIGYALLFWLVYLGGFYFYHQKDIKELKVGSFDSYWGESCYDPGTMTGNYDMDPQAIYKRKIWYRDNPLKPYPFYGLGDGQQNTRSIETVPEEYKDDPLYKEAVEEANRNKQEFLDEINWRRKDGFEEDFKANALWSGIISLLFFVLGRYLIKSFNWVNENKSNEPEMRQ